MSRLANVLIALLLLSAVWFRVSDLGELPGVNGDEAWYGNLVHDILAGQPRFLTPSRIPINPFYVVPLTLTHLVAGDSVAALRSIALLSGLATLALNFWLARRFFGRRTAVVSTVMLAVLPIMIAYSRFGWDTAQMPLASLCVLYAALHAHRASTERNVRLAWITLILSLLVHPTALFLVPLTVLGTLDGLSRDVPLIAKIRQQLGRWMGRSDEDTRAIWLGATMTIAASVVLHDWLKGSWLPVHTAARATDFFALFADLFSGRTIFTFLTGAVGDPWLWMAARFVILAGTALSFRSLLRSSDATDRLLSRGLLTGLAAFLVAGGPHALSPGYERYAMFLIVPVVVLWTRVIVTLCEAQASVLSPPCVMCQVLNRANGKDGMVRGIFRTVQSPSPQPSPPMEAGTHSSKSVSGERGQGDSKSFHFAHILRTTLQPALDYRCASSSSPPFKLSASTICTKPAALLR